MFDLKRFRKERKISQVALADQLGVGQSFISQIESGKDPMPDLLIKKLSDIYHVNNISDYLIEDIIEENQHFYGGGDSDMVSMPREVFDQISKLTETVLSQQKTIEILAETNKKITVRLGDNAICADASGSGIKK